MNTAQLLAKIKAEVESATKEKRKDAVNMYLVVKYADQLKDIDPVAFARAIGRTDAYSTEFRKGINLAQIIKERGL